MYIICVLIADILFLFSKIDGEAAALVPILNEYNILQIVVCFIAFVSFTILNPSSLAVVYYI